MPLTSFNLSKKEKKRQEGQAKDKRLTRNVVKLTHKGLFGAEHKVIDTLDKRQDHQTNGLTGPGYGQVTAKGADLSVTPSQSRHVLSLAAVWTSAQKKCKA